MATSLANEKNTEERDISAQHRVSKFCFVLRIKKCRVFEDIFSGT